MVVEHGVADAPAGHEVDFGEAVEGDDGDVFGEGGGGGHVAVEGEVVVDFVGDDEEVVVCGDVDNFLEDFRTVEGAGGVVGVDEDDGFGAWRDLGADVVDVRLPVLFFDAAVGDGDGVVKFCEKSILRVGGAGDEHFVAGVEAGVEEHLESFGDAGGEADVVHGVGNVVAVFLPVDDGLA